MIIQPIVEGQGDVAAVPLLLRRLRVEAQAWGLEVGRPHKRRRTQLVKKDTLQIVVRVAALRESCAGILILFDADDDCPAELAPTLEQWACEAAGEIPCAVVMANREYEAWFLAGIEALRGRAAILSDATHPVWLLITLHLLFLFAAAVMCHGRLASERPAPRYLTEFYLLLAAGGALGGLFNALLAPLLFTTVVEYPLALVLVCLLQPPLYARETTLKDRSLDVGFAILLGVLTALLTLMVPLLGLKTVQARNALVLGLPVVLAYAFVDRPARFGLAVGALMLGATLFPRMYGGTVATSRNFFGVSRVVIESNGNFRRLVHGSTIHGRQWIDPSQPCEPLAYYHRTGPAGRVFKSYNAQPATAEVAVIGLGIGELLAYAQADRRWTFYEINPDIIRIARDTNYFTFLSRCAPGPFEVVLGDARLRLHEARPGQYGLIVLDAFSSDAIPVHLLTREAIELYLAKLAPAGFLAFHISNRSLALQPVLGDLAGELNLVCLARDDRELDPFQVQGGKEPSHWLVLARRPEDLGTILRDARWQPVSARPGKRVWTDDFSNLLGAMKWR